MLINAHTPPSFQDIDLSMLRAKLGFPLSQHRLPSGKTLKSGGNAIELSLNALFPNKKGHSDCSPPIFRARGADAGSRTSKRLPLRFQLAGSRNNPPSKWTPAIIEHFDFVIVAGCVTSSTFPSKAPAEIEG